MQGVPSLRLQQPDPGVSPQFFVGVSANYQQSPSPHPGAVTPPKAHRLGMQSPRVKYRSGTPYFQTTHARSGPTGEAGRVAPRVPLNLGFGGGGFLAHPSFGRTRRGPAVTSRGCGRILQQRCLRSAGSPGKGCHIMLLPGLLLNYCYSIIFITILLLLALLSSLILS